MTGTDQSGDRIDRVFVGKCPNCDYITGDQLDYRFPNPSECRDCGAEITNTTVADAETVRTLQKEGPA